MPRRHPIEVAAQGIDFAIMRDETIGMRPRPGWKRVGRKALMDKRKRRFEQGIGEVLEIFAELCREQEAFVDDGARRKRHGIEAGGALVGQMVDRVRNRLAQYKKPPLEHGLVLDMRAALDENLAAYRLGRPDALAKTRRIGRRVAPPEQ